MFPVVLCVHRAAFAPDAPPRHYRGNQVPLAAAGSAACSAALRRVAVRPLSHLFGPTGMLYARTGQRRAYWTAWGEPEAAAPAL